MDWGKIENLVELAKQQLEIEKKKDELRSKFIEAFGIEPRKVTTEVALVEYNDSEIPKDIRTKIYSLLNDLGCDFDFFKIHMAVYRTIYDENHDWKARYSIDITVEKREDKLCYLFEICPCTHEYDC